MPGTPPLEPEETEAMHAMLIDHYQEEGRRLRHDEQNTFLDSLFTKFVHLAMARCYEGESTMHRLQVLWKVCLHWQVGMRAAEQYLLWLRDSCEFYSFVESEPPRKKNF